jgi:CHAT domain-containing protein
VLIGKHATRAQVESALGSSTILHFAGHAVQANGGTELLLAKSSSDDRSPWVDSAFLRRYPPRACRLAVLSACSSGKREASWNQPLQNIVETLGTLGVPEIVATRWQIDSQAAVPFMDAFYRELSKGDSVPIALSAARRVLCSQSRYNNPYYWGAYYSTGTGTTHLQGVLNAAV